MAQAHQEVVRRLRRVVSLMCMRCSYSIYLSRKTEIWRPWEHHQLTRARSGDCLKNPSVSKIAEMEDFCGFTREQILEASSKNQGRLCVLFRNTRDSGTFEGFDAMEIRNCKRINEEKIVLRKRDTTTFVLGSLTKFSQKHQDWSLYKAKSMFQRIILKRPREESIVIAKIALEHHSSQKYPVLLTMEILAI